jgi:hypothetical protein
LTKRIGLIRAHRHLARDRFHRQGSKRLHPHQSHRLGDWTCIRSADRAAHGRGGVRAQQAEHEFFNRQRRQRPALNRIVHRLEKPREGLGERGVERRCERRHR